jgi:hypothetical protein
MKKAVISLLLASGFAMAATHAVPKEHAVPPQPEMSSWTKTALRTQSPAVKFNKHGVLKPGYRVVKGHGTINAFVPFGK